MAIHNLYIYLWHSFSPYVTFWARCVSQRLAYRGHGHDWQSICVHYICHDLDVHTGTFPHQYQVKNSVLKYWNYDANSFWVKWRDVFKRDEPVNLALGSTPDFEPLVISNIYDIKTSCNYEIIIELFYNKEILHSLTLLHYHFYYNF